MCGSAHQARNLAFLSQRLMEPLTLTLQVPWCPWELASSRRHYMALTILIQDTKSPALSPGGWVTLDKLCHIP